jgi:hypothetical protein
MERREPRCRAARLTSRCATVTARGAMQSKTPAPKDPTSDSDNQRPSGSSLLPRVAGKVDSQASTGIQGRSMTPINEFATPQTWQTYPPGMPRIC